MYFCIMYQLSCAYGSRHFFKFVSLSKYLSTNLSKIVRKVFADIAYFAHPENVLFAMIHDEEADIRFEAYDRILSIRQKSDVEDGGRVREYVLPEINFDADTYVRMISWDDIALTEPVYTRSMSEEEIKTYVLADSAIEDIEVPCHNQSTK